MVEIQLRGAKFSGGLATEPASVKGLPRAQVEGLQREIAALMTEKHSGGVGSPPRTVTLTRDAQSGNVFILDAKQQVDGWSWTVRAVAENGSAAGAVNPALWPALRAETPAILMRELRMNETWTFGFC